MYYIIIPETLIGMFILLILCIVWGTGSLISASWAILLYGVFFILSILLLSMLFLTYLVGDDEKKGTPLYIRIFKFCCTFLFPFLTMCIVKKQIIDKYKYDDNTEFPIKGNVLLVLMGCIVIMILLFMLISKLNIFISIVIWSIVLLFSQQIKVNIVEQIAKHEIVTVISFEDKKTGKIYNATGNYYYNSGMLGDVTKDQVEVIDDNGEAKMLYRRSVRVCEYISRYDVLVETNADVNTLLNVN